MYKALNVRDNTEVVILDQKWLQSINQLRELDRNDFLVCQSCKQPVRVRAGEQRQEHFAHKHLENCDYADESAFLRDSRAILYKWLVSKFGEKVTIEKKIDGIDLFRPIDCWVMQDSKAFAYWIFDSTLKPEKRAALQNCVEKLGIHFCWVFSISMLHTEPDKPDNLILSTTEREFMQYSKYDMVYTNGYSATKGSLHYLDIKSQKLLTFRSLSLYHEPQVYKGYNLISNLNTVLVSPQTGEFIHNGEYDKLQEYEKKQTIINKSRNRQWGKTSQQRNSHIHRQSYEVNTSVSYSNIKSQSNISKSQNKKITLLKVGSKTGICVFCGETTKDWWSYDGKTGKCKCRPCLQKGKS